MLLVNLSQQTAKLEEDFAALKDLAGMMVATLQINFLRGGNLFSKRFSAEILDGRRRRP